MRIPSPFAPSSFARRVQYDDEGRMREYRPGTQGDTGIGDSNSLFATESERFDAITPFLKRSKAAADKAREYVIQPGGACLYKRVEEEPYYSQRKFEYPDGRQSFGHRTSDLEGTKMAGHQGQFFTLSRGG